MKKTIFLFILIILLSGAGFVGIKMRNRLPQELEVHFIDIGQGDAILVRTKNGKNMLIDSGSAKESHRLIDYLHSEGIQFLDVVIATHPDEDHIGSMSEVIRKFKIGSFYMPNKTHTTLSFEEMIAMLKEKKIEVIQANAGNTIPLDEEIELFIMNPDDRIYTDNNNYSVVTKLTYQKNSFLFTGDIDAVNEYVLISEFGDKLDSDILKLAHHGSSGSSSPDFIRAVSPVAAVASCGIGNHYGHPHKEVSALLQNLGIPLYRTDEQGSLVFYSDGENIRVNASTPGRYS